jgi:DNA-binding NarL/FixJ family response regulator
VPSEAAGSIHIAVVSTICAAREGLCTLLERDVSIIVEHQGDTSAASIASLRDVALDVVLVDGSCREGLESVPRIREQTLTSAVLVYGVQPKPDVLLSCACNGATLVASQDTEIGALVELVKNAASGRLGGEALLNATLLVELASLARGASQLGSTSLTRREQQVALAIAGGLTNKQIAQQFCISLSTVKSHVHCVLRKLSVGHRDEVFARLRDSVAI